MPKMNIPPHLVPLVKQLIDDSESVKSWMIQENVQGSMGKLGEHLANLTALKRISHDQMEKAGKFAANDSAELRGLIIRMAGAPNG